MCGMRHEIPLGVKREHANTLHKVKGFPFTYVFGKASTKVREYQNLVFSIESEDSEWQVRELLFDWLNGDHGGGMRGFVEID